MKIDNALAARFHRALWLAFCMGLCTPQLASADAGGTDIVIEENDSFGGMARSSKRLAVASDGTLYAAFSYSSGASGTSMYVYRSEDDGLTWSQWGSLSEDGATWWNQGYGVVDLLVAEGTVDRIYVLCSYVGPNFASYKALLLYSDRNLPTASWEVATVHTTSAESERLSPVRLATDAAQYDAFYLFVLLQRNQAGTRDLFFSRSTDLGANWVTPYALTSSVPNSSVFWEGDMAYGRNGVLHVVCTRTVYPSGGGSDGGIYYRRADSWASSPAAWSGIREIVSANDGVYQYQPTVAASHLDNTVLIAFNTYGGGVAKVLRSSDAGIQFDLGAPYLLPAGSHRIDIDPFAGRSILCTLDAENRFVIRSAHVNTPLAFGAPEAISDFADAENAGYLHASPHPDGSGRLYYHWGWRRNSTAIGRFMFDSSSHGVVGYPNIKPGFPVALSAYATSAPALANLDHDSELEIVFGDRNGYVQVFDADGTVMPGWPQFVDPAAVGQIQTPPIAVADINEDGVAEIIAPTRGGQVYAFSADGTLLDGWPMDFGTSRPAYVAVGTVSRVSKREIVAASGRRVALLRFDGSPRFEFAPLSSNIAQPFALADLDADLHDDILVPLSTTVAGLDYPSPSPTRTWTVAPHAISDAVTVGDVDRDGDFEIAIPTIEGVVHLQREDGTAVPGWPMDHSADGAATSVALVNVLGTAELEVVFANRLYRAWVHTRNGAVASTWPHATTSGWYLFGMPVVDTVDEGSPDILLPSRDGNLYGWTNVAGDIPGWPKSLGTQINVSAATGDVDADGRTEIVVCSQSALYLIEVQAAVRTNVSNGSWPMYGHDAARTGCQGCSQNLVTGVPESLPLPSSLVLHAPYPNPSDGGTVVRFALPKRATLRLAVHDLRGRRVRTLHDGEHAPGAHAIIWDARDDHGRGVASGVYFLRLEADGQERLQRVILMR